VSEAHHLSSWALTCPLVSAQMAFLSQYVIVIVQLTFVIVQVADASVVPVGSLHAQGLRLLHLD